MREDEENNLQLWVESHENAVSALCDVEVIQQFASWLCHYARTQVRGEYLSLGSILDILSSTKKLFNAVFPSNSIFASNKDQI